ncbi:MAG: hypothetical protein C3F02_04875 [Parcubacteria group bacterium]|nr:MAG: hypothetical protein C3F02_04875 [Parcubacteria group bacterium]
MQLAINLPLVLRWLKKYLGEILLVFGTALTVFNLSGFVHKSQRFYTPPKPPAVTDTYWQSIYYFTDTQRILITIGIILIITGILVLKNKKNRQLLN